MLGINSLRRQEPSRLLCWVLQLAFLILMATRGYALATDSIRIINPSFEADSFTTEPGLVHDNGPITGWASSGLVGLNPWRGPFGDSSPYADAGVVPDGRQVAFLQTNVESPRAELSQVVSGLETGEVYWLQVSVNKRRQIDVNHEAGQPRLHVSYAGEPVLDWLISEADPDQQRFTGFFRPSVSSGALTIRSEGRINAPPVDTDRALIVDALSFIQRDPDEVLLFNPSFEARGTYGPETDVIAGWKAEDLRLVNVLAAPGALDGINAARFVGAAALSQPVRNLVPETRTRFAMTIRSREIAPAGYGSQLEISKCFPDT